MGCENKSCYSRMDDDPRERSNTSDRLNEEDNDSVSDVRAILPPTQRSGDVIS